MEYHEVRTVAELRKQGEHERDEEFRLKAMRRTPRRIPEHLVPSAGTPSDSAAPALTPCVADDDHSPGLCGRDRLERAARHGRERGGYTVRRDRLRAPGQCSQRRPEHLALHRPPTRCRPPDVQSSTKIARQRSPRHKSSMSRVSWNLGDDPW